MSLTDDDWERIESALAFRATKLYEQGMGSALRDSNCAEARRYDEIIQKVRDFRRATGWQPIETAPKDGSEFLGCGGVWDAACIFCWDNGWLVGCDMRWRGLGDREIPTHWMPLPEPPKGGGE